MLNARLIVVGGDAADKEITLELPAIIGRGRETSITVQHALVSRQHCEIYEHEGRLFVRDLGSLNGTYVNNFRIRNDEPLLPGQLLTLGNITFRASYAAENGVADTPAERPSAKTVQKPRSAPQEVVPNAGPAPSGQTTHPGPAPRRMAPPSREPPLIAAAGNGTLHDAPSVHAGSVSASGSGPDSDVLSGFEFVATPQHSISISALGSLPASGPSASFVAAVIPADPKMHPEVGTGELELPDVLQQPVPKVDPDDSSLGSFVRRLPR